VALERTTSEPIRDSEVAIASGRLNARKSVSGSGRSLSSDAAYTTPIPPWPSFPVIV
jgi:hypothetical protein